MLLVKTARRIQAPASIALYGANPVGRCSPVSWDDTQVTWLTHINQVGNTAPKESLFDCQRRLRIIFSPVSEAHSASYSLNTADYSPGIEQPEGESVHSLPSNAEVRKKKSYTSIPSEAIMPCKATTFHLSSVMKTVNWCRI